MIAPTDARTPSRTKVPRHSVRAVVMAFGHFGVIVTTEEALDFVFSAGNDVTHVLAAVDRIGGQGRLSIPAVEAEMRVAGNRHRRLSR